MSNDVEFRQHRREMAKKAKIKNTLLLFLLAAVILAIAVFTVSAIIKKSKNDNSDEGEFIFNGYVYPTPPEKNADILKDAKNPDGIKKAYLTFDDGPDNTVTPEILDVLRRYNIKATFFLVGTLIEENQGMARRIYDEGHLLANHSYSHKYNELYADTQTFMTQIDKTQGLIEKIADNPNYPKICRFPGGSHNAGTYGAIKQECKIKLEENGYRHCDWNALNGDAEKASPSEEYVISKLKKTVGENEDVVILMHNSPTKRVTAKTLPEILDYLIEKGFEFDTLDKA